MVLFVLRLFPDWASLLAGSPTYTVEMGNIMVGEDPINFLVKKAQSGDRAAFSKLVERYQARLEAQIRARLGENLRKKLETEDLLQETFSCAFESIGKFRWRDDESFYRWLG